MTPKQQRYLAWCVQSILRFLEWAEITRKSLVEDGSYDITYKLDGVVELEAYVQTVDTNKDIPIIRRRNARWEFPPWEVLIHTLRVYGVTCNRRNAPEEELSTSPYFITCTNGHEIGRIFPIDVPK